MSVRTCLWMVLILGAASCAAAVPVTDGLMIHLKADTITGLSDGDPVTTWADSATSDPVDGTVSAVAGQTLPVFRRYGVGGRPVVRFTDDVLSTATQFSLPNPSGGMTFFALFTGDSSGDPAERMAQIGDAAGAGGRVIGLDASTNVVEDNGGCGFRFNNGRALARVNNPLTTGFHIGTWQMAQGTQHQNAILYVDDTTPETLDNINNPTNTTTLPASGNIFSVGDGVLNGGWINGDYYTGDVAELLVYNRLLTISEIATVQDYLYDRYFTTIIDADPMSLSLTEGQSQTVQVSLAIQPDENVLIHLTNPAVLTQISFDPDTLEFTPTNWDQSQPVQFTAVDDILLEDRIHTSDAILIAESADGIFDGAVAAVTVTILENECGRWAYISGDFNEDCTVDIKDLEILSQHWLWCDPMKDDECTNLE